MPTIQKPYLLLLGDVRDPTQAKTAFGLRDWAMADCVGQWRFDTEAVDLDLPDMNPAQAVAAGARTLVIGITAPGGTLPPHWSEALAKAAEAGLDLASGMHQRLESLPEVAAAVARTGVRVHNVRHSDGAFRVGTGVRRTGKRLLTVGTDCALGKKYTALAIARAMRERGVDADFRATGQTGILISGSGVSIDAIVADFISGAAEQLSPANAPGHWDIVEGQGSLFHPSYAGVTLGLIHGSQPDFMVLCHHPRRKSMRGLPHFALPDLEQAIASYLAAASLTNPAARMAGIALNTVDLDEAEARSEIAHVAGRLGLPCVDPVRFGVAPILEALEATGAY